ncbi:hypothetical protein, partial [Microlunatus speluncae]|uniref:hypothetical protein n=1 Tax=Microlunatus speluncae TaxID=2594267 RepID=UPI001C2DD993
MPFGVRGGPELFGPLGCFGFIECDLFDLDRRANSYGRDNIRVESGVVGDGEVVSGGDAGSVH